MRNRFMLTCGILLAMGQMSFAETTAQPAPDSLIFTAPDGYKSVEFGTITANQIEGVKVYDPKEEMIGRVSDIVIDADGKVSGVVVDVGGLFGIDTHKVALTSETISFFNGADGVLRAFVGLTKEQLEALPVYKTR